MSYILNLETSSKNCSVSLLKGDKIVNIIEQEDDSYRHSELLTSFVDQIHIKAQRIRNLQINKDQKIDEGQVPEFIGIINYCIMSLIQIQIGVVDEPDLNGTEVVELYDNKVNETFELMLKKNHDYGEAWRDMEISSLTDLIIQKIFRMKSINSNDGKTISSEGVESNFQDILNYSVFALRIIL